MIWPTGQDRLVENTRLRCLIDEAQQFGEQFLHRQIIRRALKQGAKMLLGCVEQPPIAQDEREDELRVVITRSGRKGGAIRVGSLVPPPKVAQRVAEAV